MARAGAALDRPTIEVADVLRRHGEAYRRDHVGHVGRTERQRDERDRGVPNGGARRPCRACDDCGARRIAYNSCRNRHCPKCQAPRARNGSPTARPNCCRFPISTSCSRCRRRSRPSPSRTRRAVYAILFRTAAEALTTLAANHRSARRADRRPDHPAHLGRGADPPPSRPLSSSPAADFRSTAPDGSPASPASSCPSGRCRGCSAACSSNACSRLRRGRRLGFFGDLAPLAEKSRLRRRARAAAPRRVPSRWGCRHPHPSQTRTCRFPASGSSRESFARCGVSVEDPDWRQWVPGQQFVEAGP